MVAVSVWLSVFALGVHWPLAGLPPMVWHAHEMIFGYVLAVVAGFLLTAVRNWTGVPTATGGLLLVMVGCWLGARLTMLLAGANALMLAAALDLLFLGLLSYNLLNAIVRSKNWQQMAVWSKVVLFGLANACFYLGVWVKQPELTLDSLNAGLFLVVGLMLMLGRRLIPFFIERAAPQPVALVNRDWLDRLALLVFLLFFVLVLYDPMHAWTVGSAAALFVIHAWRLYGWHTSTIWKTPLVWVLFVAYGFMVLGFLLFALNGWPDSSTIPIPLSTHAFAYGGMGMMTVGMMSRISLGHTGRDVYSPPKGLGWIFAALLLGACVRILLPWWLPSTYTQWIVLAQCLWIAAFVGFVVLYAPILTRPRVDGKAG